MTQTINESFTDTISPDGQWRWDGHRWVPVAQAPVQPAAATKGSGTGKKLALGLGGGFVALLMFGAMVTSGDTTSSSTPPTTTDQVEKTPSLPAPPAEDPAVELTLAQENAIDAAENYLDMSGFSRSGLIDQLEFEDYSVADATFAVDHLDVDWNAEAAESAESYLEMTSFSRSGLIEHLEFEGFTTAQAEKGVKAVGY